MVGDVINLKLLVYHQMNLIDAKAVFTHSEVEDVEITLEGEPEVYSARRGPLEKNLYKKESFVVMNEEVTVEHIPGVYRFSYVEFQTTSLGQPIRLDERQTAVPDEDKEFEIIAEPSEIKVVVHLAEEQHRYLNAEEVRRELTGEPEG